MLRNCGAFEAPLAHARPGPWAFRGGADRAVTRKPICMHWLFAAAACASTFRSNTSMQVTLYRRPSARQTGSACIGEILGACQVLPVCSMVCRRKSKGSHPALFLFFGTRIALTDEPCSVILQGKLSRLM